MTVRLKITSVVVLLIAAAVGIALAWWLAQPVTFQSGRISVMGTECYLTAKVRRIRASRHESAFRSAEAELRRVEALMSAHLVASELGRFNAAPAGQTVELSRETMQLLRVSRRLARQTGGAFDVTCRPVLQAWKRAGRAGRLPSLQELARAHAASGWENVDLLEGAARKRVAGAGIDLGGIAKGYGTDRACRAMEAEGVSAGLVNVGGDMRVFSPAGRQRMWRIGVQSPFEKTLIGVIEISRGAICTSGDYRRFTEIAGKRYSHIVDPRTGWPTDVTPSVTVVAPDATTADAWATALSVLGPEGLKLLPTAEGVEAMVIAGTAENYQCHVTAGFMKFFVEQSIAKLVVHYGPASPSPSSASAPAAGTTLPEGT